MTPAPQKLAEVSMPEKKEHTICCHDVAESIAFDDKLLVTFDLLGDDSSRAGRYTLRIGISLTI